MKDLQQLIGKKVLITTSVWFVAPNGQEYRSVYGTLHNIQESKETLGFTPRGNHANWYMLIGSMVITGCQINYLAECPNPPDLTRKKTWSNLSGQYNEYERPTIIYNADIAEDNGSQVLPLSIHELEADRLQWSLTTFTEATAISSLRKCEAEILEIEQTLNEGKPDVTEYADAMMCLLDSAGRAGISVGDILKAFKEKTEINKKRSWKKNADNSYSHV